MELWDNGTCCLRGTNLMIKNKSTTNIWRNKWLVSIVVGLVVAGGVFMGLMGVYHYVHRTNLARTQETADEYGASLQLITRGLTADTIRLADMARQQRTSDAWFLPAAQSVLGNGSHATGVQYSPMGRPPMSSPAGFSIGGDPGLAAAFAKLQEEAMRGDGVSMVVGPVTRQDGTMVVIAMSPVLAFNSRTSQFDYIGNVSVTMKLPDVIVNEAYQALQNSGDSYALYGNNKNLENDGLIACSETEVEGEFASASARVPGGYWQVRMAPQDSWTRQGSTVGMGAGAVLGLIFGGLTFLLMKSREPKAVSATLPKGATAGESLPTEEVPEEELDDIERALLKRRRFHEEYARTHGGESGREYVLKDKVTQEAGENEDNGAKQDDEQEK